MKIIPLLILIISILILSPNSQEKNLLEYYKGIHLATYKYKENNYEESFKILDDLYKTYGKEMSIEDNSYELYVVTAEKSNSKYSRYEAIKFLIERCGYSLHVLKSEKRGLDVAFEKSGISKKEYEVLKEKYRNSINKSLRKVVKGIVKRDQLYRRGYKGKFKLKKIDSVDAINNRALKKIFKKYGYPGKKLIGSSFFDGDYIVLSPTLRHLSSKDSYFTDKLLDFIKYDGTFPPGLYASIIDVPRKQKGQPPLYEYSNYNSKKDIDNNRYNVGLPPLDFK